MMSSELLRVKSTMFSFTSFLPEGTEPQLMMHSLLYLVVFHLGLKNNQANSSSF